MEQLRQMLNVPNDMWIAGRDKESLYRALEAFTIDLENTQMDQVAGNKELDVGEIVETASSGLALKGVFAVQKR